MAIPTNRTPVRVARGAAVKFTETIDGVAGAGAKELQDGEIVWDETNEKFQLKVGGSSSTTLKDHTVDTSNLAPKASPTFTGIPAADTASVSTNTTQIATTAFVVAEIADEVGTTVQAYDADTAKLDVDQTWTGAQRGALVDLTLDGTDLDTDFNLSNNFQYTMGGNYTLAQPTNQTAGQSGSIFITQDGTGSRTLAYHADWKWAGGTAPTLSTAAASVDRIDYICLAVNKIHAVATLAVA